MSSFYEIQGKYYTEECLTENLHKVLAIVVNREMGKAGSPAAFVRRLKGLASRTAMDSIWALATKMAIASGDGVDTPPSGAKVHKQRKICLDKQLKSGIP